MNSFASSPSPISTPPSFPSSYPSPSPSSSSSPSPSLASSTSTTTSSSSTTTISQHENLKEGIHTVLGAYSTTLKQLMDALAMAARQQDRGPASINTINTLNNLNTLNTNLNTNLNSVNSTLNSLNSINSPAHHVFLKLTERDDLLRRYVEHLTLHQRFSVVVSSQGSQLAGLGAQLSSLALSLHALQADLRQALEALKPLTLDISHAQPVLANEIVSYGHKISYTTSAPPDWVPSQVAVFKPPAPQEEQVRTGLLYSKIPDKILQYYSLDDPNKPTQPTSPSLAPPSPSSSFASDGIPIQDTKPILPEVPLNVPLPPKGWKPGMPIIPLPPKGWRPGDQILGGMPLSGAALPNANETKSDSSSSEEDMGVAGDVEWE